MIFLLFLLLSIGVSAPAVAESPRLSTAIETPDTDRYGCQILPRPDRLTFEAFRDSWRSVAADELYSLRRHQLALSEGSCDCATMRPDWSIIDDEFEALGFVNGASSAYFQWSEAEYFPVISGLRAELRTLCLEGK